MELTGQHVYLVETDVRRGQNLGVEVYADALDAIALATTRCREELFTIEHAEARAGLVFRGQTIEGAEVRVTRQTIK